MSQSNPGQRFEPFRLTLHRATPEVGADVTEFQIEMHLGHLLLGAALNRYERVQIHQQFQPRHLSVRVREFRQWHLLQANTAQVKFHGPRDRAVGEAGKLQSDQHP